jgi:hypothetical protein
MVVHWQRHRDQPRWRRSQVFNATGAVLSGIVFVVAGITKFTSGAWVSIVLMALIVVAALRIHRYYELAGLKLALRPEEVTTPVAPLAPAPRVPRGRLSRDGREMAGPPGPDLEAAERPDQITNLTIVPVVSLDRPAMRALAYAASLRQPVLALHISPTEEEAERFRGYWQTWGDHLPLQIIVSPHRALVAPLANYLWSLHLERPDVTLTVAVPEIVVQHWRHKILNDHVAGRLRRTLHKLPGIIVTTVPFHLVDRSDTGKAMRHRSPAHDHH